MCKPIGNFAKNLHLGKRVLPPPLKITYKDIVGGHLFILMGGGGALKKKVQTRSGQPTAREQFLYAPNRPQREKYG